MSRSPYNLKSVVKLTGVPGSTLRSWERRYQVVTPDRDRGPRHYSEADVARLLRIKTLVDAGHRIGDLAALTDSQLAQLREEPSARARTITDAFLEALGQYDVATLDRLLARVLVSGSVSHLVDEVLAPLLRRVGDGWEKGQLSVAQERLFSSAVRDRLCALLATINPGTRTRLLCVTPEGERHELGLLMFALLAASQGVPLRYLGADLPIADIVRLARELQPDVVAISLVNEMPDPAQVLVRLREGLPRDTRLWAGGRALAALVSPPPGVRIARDPLSTQLLISELVR